MRNVIFTHYAVVICKEGKRQIVHSLNTSEDNARITVMTAQDIPPSAILSVTKIKDL